MRRVGYLIMTAVVLFEIDVVFWVKTRGIKK